MKTLDFLKDYFSTNDNTFIKKKLELLELEIQTSILDAEIKILKKINDLNN